MFVCSHQLLHASGLGVDVQGLVEVVYPDNVFVFGS